MAANTKSRQENVYICTESRAENVQDVHKSRRENVFLCIDVRLKTYSNRGWMMLLTSLLL